MRVTILRGIPGAGKSTLARSLPGIVCSADDYMVDATGKYSFDPSKLGICHQACFSKFLRHLRNGTQYLIVDNTNIRAWEIAPYYLAAEAYRYEVEIVTIICPVDIAIRRNIHGVPEGSVYRMWGDLSREKLPLHWNERKVR